MYRKIDIATDFLKQTIKMTPHVVVVLNSGLNNLINDMVMSTEIPFDSIPGFVGTTDKNKTSSLIYGIIEDKYVLVVKGKPYYYEGISKEDLAFPYRVFANLGIKNIIFTTSSGAISEELKIGDVVIFKDHISLFAPNLLIGDNYYRFGPRLIDSSNVYNARLRNRILQGINTEEETILKEGIFAYYSGPSYETPADIKALTIMGADMVGMSTVPEAIVCHHAGMNVIGLSLITNKAAGINKRPLTFREVLLAGRVSEAKQRSTIKQIIKLLPKE